MVAFMNPALAGVVTMVNDVARGFSRITRGLLGFIAVGLALAGVVKLFQHMADAARAAEEAIKRLLEAQREQRKEALGLQVSLAEKLKAAGKLGVAPEAAKYASLLMRRGIPRQLAEVGAVARVVGGLTDEQTQQLLAGYVATGEEARFERNEAENQKIIQQLLKAGETPHARAALQARMYDLAQQTKREAIEADAFKKPEQWRDTLIDRLKKRGRYSERELELISRYAEEGLGGGPADIERAHRIAFPSWWDRFKFGLPRALFVEPVPSWRKRKVEPAGRTIGQLLDEARWIGQQGERIPDVQRGRMEGALGEAGIGAGHVTINVTNNYNTQNVGTMYNDVGMVRDAFRADPDLLGLPPGAP